MSRNGKEKSLDFANNFVNIVALISTGISIIGMLFAPQIVKALAGGFDMKTYLLTVELIRITFPMIIFTSVAFSFVGFLQSFGQFNVPAMISGISNLVMIIFLVFFREKFGIHGVAYCMSFAWFLQVIVQLPFAIKYGYRFKFKINFKDENIRKVFSLALPIILSSSVLPIGNLVTTRLASAMGEGAISALEYAYKLYLVLSGVFTYAIGNVIFPELSRASALKDNQAFIQLIHKAIRMISFLLIPLTIGIIIFRQDIISIIYERGEFDIQSTLVTSRALLFYSIGIIGSGFVEILNKSFYARQDTKSPLKIGVAIIIINVLLSVVFSKFMDFEGLAFATSITAILNAIILICVAKKDQGSIITKEVLESMLKMLLCAVIMGVLIYIFNYYLTIIMPSTLLMKVFRTILGTITGMGIYIVLTMMLNVNELKLFRLGGKD